MLPRLTIFPPLISTCAHTLLTLFESSNSNDYCLLTVADSMITFRLESIRMANFDNRQIPLDIQWVYHRKKLILLLLCVHVCITVITFCIFLPSLASGQSLILYYESPSSTVLFFQLAWDPEWGDLCQTWFFNCLESSHVSCTQVSLISNLPKTSAFIVSIHIVLSLFTFSAGP